jgi:glycosyltransferase involved in cell wall biosynthesis
MVMGLPVVATRVGGIPEAVVDGETGVLVPPRQPEQLAAAIEELLLNPPRMKTMGELGRQRALAEFHPEKFARKHEALYRNLLERKQC